VLDAQSRTTDARIHVIGNAAAISPAFWRDPSRALEQGEAAAAAIACDAGLASESLAAVALPDGASYPPQAWLDSLIGAGGMDVMLCQCEEVTRRELTSVAPPRYLNAAGRAPKGGLQSLSAYAARSQDQLKRMTRVGMGHCQGRRCREHGAMVLARAQGIDLAGISPGSYRVPVRALPAKILWADDETADQRANWTTWLHEVDDPIPEAPANPGGEPLPSITPGPTAPGALA
jgi:hypothetical protein